MKLWESICLMAALALFINLVMLAKLVNNEPVFADLPIVECVELPDGRCDDYAGGGFEPEALLASFGVTTQPSIQMAMAEYDNLNVKGTGDER